MSWYIFALLAFASGFIDEDDELFGSQSQLRVSIPLQHSYNGIDWEERGNIVISTQGDRRRKPSISIINHTFDKNKLDIKGFYYIRLLNPSGSFVYSTVKTCSLISTDLLESIQLVMDQDTFEPVGLNYSSGSACAERTPAKSIETIGDVLLFKEAGRPYFSPPKVISEAQQQGFLSRYWWVILLGILFMMFTGGQEPQQAASS